MEKLWSSVICVERKVDFLKKILLINVDCPELGEMGEEEGRKGSQQGISMLFKTKKVDITR